MELSKNFEHQSAEQRWYQHWLDKNYFKSTPDDREPYTIVIPPPNVTGVLHMGHCLNNTIQDILVRRARMQGKNACWVPGTDHASIATEAKVVQMLRERGISKSSLSRDEFLQYAWEWKEKYGGIIDASGWSEGYCPICGKEPKIGEIKGDEDSRFLFCNQCGFEWNYSRVKCPFCGNEEQHSLAYFTVEGEERYRVDVCNVCKRYVKIVDFRDTGEKVNLDVEDIATLHLDMLASEEGYE